MSSSLLRAIEILDCFIENKEMSLNQLVAETGMSKTTVFRLTSSLVEAGLLIKEKKSSHHVIFYLSLKFLTYGRKVSEHLEYKEIAYPYMRRLNEELNELVHLTAKEGDEAVYVETCYSTRTVRLVFKIGTRVPLYAGSAPKLLLAYSSEKTLETYFKTVKFEKITHNTINSIDKLKEELRKIKKQGYSTSQSESFDKTRGFSFPIFNYEGKVVAAIGISLPEQEYTKEKEQTIITKLKETALEISKNLGFEEAN